jgi:hypothetical protein
MSTFTAFADESSFFGIGDLTVENGTETVAIYGTLTITRDKEGLAAARKLKAILDAAVVGLEADKDLPETIAVTVRPTTVRNPFD